MADRRIGQSWQRRDKDLSTPARAGLAMFSATLLTLGTAAALRGKRLRGLQSLVPKVSTKNPQEFISLLKKGDLVFTEMSPNTSAPIKYIQRSAVGNMAHVSVYTGGNNIAHVTPRTKNWVEESMEHWFKKGKNLIVVRPGDAALGERIAAEAKSSVGKYRFTQKGHDVLVGSMGFLPHRMSKNLMRIKDGKVICATATADIMQRAGASLPKPPGHMVTVDFRTMSNPPILHFQGTKGMIRTSSYQGAGFVIPGMAIGGIATTGKVPYAEKVSTAFEDELEKIARWGAMGAAIGAVGGGLLGAFNAAEGKKMQGALGGAALGAGAGLAGGAGASKLWASPSRIATKLPAPSKALSTFGLTGNTSKKGVKDAYRGYMRKHHPDVGGTQDAASAGNAAMKTIKDSSWFQKLSSATKESFYRELKSIGTPQTT